MNAERPLRPVAFPPFRLDPDAAVLYRGQRVVDLRPKAFALLRQLVTNAGTLLTKDALLESIWPNRIVSEGGLTELVRELRKALGDDARTPAFIETVHGRGYRFIASPNLAEPTEAFVAPACAEESATVPFVGRDGELRFLHRRLALAASGNRQLVFVTGEPGIGKTSLLEAFRRHSALDALPSGSNVPWMVRGQCIEQYGAGEAYLPILDALGRLSRVAGEEVVNTLSQYAPTWLDQLPALQRARERHRPASQVMGTTRERMMREMSEALEALTVAHPLVLVLEDLHWSDYSTLDLISFVAQREEHARLMIIGTYRPEEVYVREHPLKAVKQELQARGQCVELTLPCLSQATVAEYLRQRFGNAHSVPATDQLAPVVHRRTDGHPLFMVNVVDYVAAQAFAGLPESVDQSIPDSVRQMIEKQIDRLCLDEQTLLEAASVAGVDFSAASVAAGLAATDADAVEQLCASLARRALFLVARGSDAWPDGSLSGRYGFIHALYQNVLYFRIPPGRRARLHLRVGLREESGFRDQTADIAGELALHFEEGHDYERALHYLSVAGEKAVRRCANREAIDVFSRGLSLLGHLPDSVTRRRHELVLQLALGPPLIHSHGYAADEVARTYGRAREIHDEVGEPTQLLSILWGQWLYLVVRGEHSEALDIGIQLQKLERTHGINLPWAHYAVGCSLFWLGKPSESAAALEYGLDRYEARTHAAMVPSYSQDPKTVSLLYRAWDQWVLGCPEQALSSCMTAVTWAESLRHPFSLAFALNYCAVVLFLRREPALVREHAGRAMALSAEHGFPFWHAWSVMMHGWAQVKCEQTQDGIARLRQGFEAYESTGAQMGKSMFLLMLADACASVGATRDGLDAVSDAFAYCAFSHEHAFLPELHRIKGELTLVAGTRNESLGEVAAAQAAASFQQALALARAQGALGLELRAAVSLARLWQRQKRNRDARALLETLLPRFSEGVSLRDWQEAASLVTAL